MANFVQFKDMDGNRVSINIDLITIVREDKLDGTTFIGFGKDRGVMVPLRIDQVMNVLNPI